MRSNKFAVGFAAVLVSWASLACSSAGISTSQRCEAAIRAAVIEKHPDHVPQECWRIGPVALGMSHSDTEKALGVPDYTTHGGNLFYLYPQNLRHSLKRHPIPPSQFQFVHMTIVYRDDRVVLIAAPGKTEVEYPPCKERKPLAWYVTTTKPKLPFRFGSIAVGDRLQRVFRKLGPYVGRNGPGDWFEYWPVPLELTSDESVHPRTLDSVAVAVDEQTMRYIPTLHVRTELDPDTCLVTGYNFVDD